MKFKNYLKYKNLDFDNMNKAMFQDARDHFFHLKNKTGINEAFLLSEEELESKGFFQKYNHLR